MARIDALEALGRKADAVRSITEVANRVSSGNIGVESMDDAEFMFDRMSRLMADAKGTIENLRHDLSVLMDNQNEQKRLDHLARTWLQAQLPLTTPEPDTPVEPTFFFHTAEEGKYGLVYLNLTKDPTEPRIVLAALHLPTLESQLRVLLLQKEEGQDLAIRSIMQPEADPSAWTISLAPHLSPWLIVPDPAFIQEARAAAARQTLSFLALTILLLAALLVTIYLMVAALRRQLALAQLKSQFVANVSHELKTPLALIRLFGETLLAGRVSTVEKANEYFRIITRESERLTHLIDNILDFSRIEAGQKEYRKVRADVGQVVSETIAAYRYQLEHHGFRHQVTVASDLPHALIDPDAIQQAIINLINNSIKYSPREKWIGITVERTVTGGQDSVCVAISDRGAGFSPADRKRLFEPFYRVSSDMTLNVRGTGLGLSLVKHIVDAHNGWIEVVSRPGQGSTFKILLPAADSGNTDGTDKHS
jgi:signal transduction histidine kinase